MAQDEKNQADLMREDDTLSVEDVDRTINAYCRVTPHYNPCVGEISTNIYHDTIVDLVNLRREFCLAGRYDRLKIHTDKWDGEKWTTNSKAEKNPEETGTIVSQCPNTMSG